MHWGELGPAPRGHRMMTLVKLTTWATWGAAAALVMGLGVVAVTADDWGQWRA